jgi:hypothetical protein
LVDNSHLEEDRNHPAYDRIRKVQWLIESFASISQSLYNCERICTVDEIMLPYKRFCNIQQYMKAKPCKWGIKMWALASNGSRYVSNIIVYLGALIADERLQAAVDREDDDVVGNVGEEAMLTAVKGLEHRGHIIVTNNFFNSPQLCMSFMHRGFWTTRTVRKTRRGFPSSLAGFPVANLLPMAPSQ